MLEAKDFPHPSTPRLPAHAGGRHRRHRRRGLAITVGVATQKLVFVALAAAWLGTYALASRFIHEQFSSRRTGTPSCPDSRQSVLLTGILASGVLTLALVAGPDARRGQALDLGHWPLWAPVVAGFILAGGFLTRRAFGLWRFHGYAAAAVSGGLFLLALPVRRPESTRAIGSPCSSSRSAAC